MVALSKDSNVVFHIWHHVALDCTSPNHGSAYKVAYILHLPSAVSNDSTIMATRLQALEALLQQPVSYDSKDQAARRQAALLARKLLAKVETPLDTMLRLAWQELQLIAALKTCYDLKIFSILKDTCHATDDPDLGYVSTADLSKATGPDPKLLARMLRHIAAMGYLSQNEDGTAWAPSRLTNAIAAGQVDGSLDFMYDVALPCLQTLPTHLAETGYADPQEDEKGNGNWARHMPDDGPRNMWQFLAQNPTVGQRFGKFMGEYAADNGSWVELYPFQEKLLEDAELGRPLIVDLGGSFGHDMKKLIDAATIPSAAKIIVQDLPGVIEDASKLPAAPNISFMAHDFFTPQPETTRGARTYFLHSILHDYPDEECLKILDHIKAACKPGYSTLLINEAVIPSRDAHPVATGLDLVVMSALSGRERSQEDWESLLGKAGFEIRAWWSDTAVSYSSVIEAVPVSG